MQAGFERFIALRYLKRARGHTAGRRFLRLITYIAVGSVAIGVCALILALSIVRGFSREIERKIVGFGADVQVESYRDAPLDEAVSLGQSLSGLKDVVRVSPVVQEFVLLRSSGKDIDGVSIWGSDRLPPYLESSLIEGTSSFDVEGKTGGGVVIGRSLARSLHLRVGDRVTVFSVRSRSGASRRRTTPRVKQFYITGIYETSLANFDDLYVFTAIESARNLLSYRADQVTRFDLTLVPGTDVDTAARQIDATLEFPTLARSIREVYRSLFAWVNLQQTIIPLVIAIIVLVAAFNIVGTLLMIILEKTPEVGILSSMGASQRSLRRLFLYLGLSIGVVGTVIGEIVAFILSELQIRYSLIPLPRQAYYMDTAPIQLSINDFVIVAVVTLLLCAVSSYVPARMASRIEPLRAIHLR